MENYNRLYEEISYDKHPFIHINVMELGRYPLHMHEDMEFLFVLSGKVEADFSLYCYEIESGHIILINPHTLHSIQKKSETAVVASIYIKPAYFETYHEQITKSIFFYNSFRESDYYTVQNYIKNQLFEILLTYFDIGIRKTTLQEQCVSCIFYLINYSRSWRTAANKIELMSNYKKNGAQIDYLNQILWYIYANSNKKISLQMLSEEFHISKFYISHLFREGVNRPFQEYLIRARIEESIKLLHGTSLTVEEIAEKCGFSSLSFFRKKFRQIVPDHYGKTPFEERERLRNGTLSTTAPEIKMILDVDEIKVILANTDGSARGIPAEKQIIKLQCDFNSTEKSELSYAGNHILFASLSDLHGTYLKHLHEMELSYDTFICLDSELIENHYQIFQSWSFMETILYELQQYGFHLKILYPDGNDLSRFSQLSQHFQGFRARCPAFHMNALRRSEAVICQPMDYIGDYLSFLSLHRNQAVLFPLEEIMLNNGLKTPAAYGMMYFNLLEPTVIQDNANCIISKSEDQLRILIFSAAAHASSASSEHIIQLKNLPQQSILNHQEITKFSCQDARIWKSLDIPVTISKELKQSIENMSRPVQKQVSPIFTSEYDIFLTLSEHNAHYISLSFFSDR